MNTLEELGIPEEMTIACTGCGHRNGTLALFCHNCGVKLPPPKNPVDPHEQKERIREFCLSRDGHILQVAIVNAKFCSKCGIKLIVV